MAESTEESTEDDVLEQTDTIAQALQGEPIWFDVDSVRWGIRHPSTEEYDDAVNIQNIMRRRTLLAPEAQELRGQPCSPDERETFEALIRATQDRLKGLAHGSLEQRHLLARLGRLQKMLAERTLADEIADERALVARDRYLTLRLLVDAAGEQVFDVYDPAVKRAWDKFPMKVKNAARSAVWLVMQVIENIPLASAPPPKSN